VHKKLKIPNSEGKIYKFAQINKNPWFELKNPTRITLAIDEETNKLFEQIKKETGISKSELIRRALKFYLRNESIMRGLADKKVYSYLDMLPSGEHIILDVDHWLLFLKLIDTSPEKENFWENCREIARAHGEQLQHKVSSVEELLERLEACNFFKVMRDSKDSYTLLLGSDIPKKFIRIFLEEVFACMGFKGELKEDLAKIRVKTLPK
jgi:hypothetical protein